MNATEKRAQADVLEAQVKKLRKEAYEMDQEAGRQRPLAERLRYAATARCKCGAGLAYDPYKTAAPDSPFTYGPEAWECSAVLLGLAQQGDAHVDPLPFAFYEIKSEDQPSARGLTTRPA